MKNFKEMIKSNYNFFIEYVKDIKGRDLRVYLKKES